MGRQRGLPEDLPTEGELDLAHPIREQPIVSDTWKPMRQDMQEKAPQELDGVERHGALPIATLVILPAECHLAISAGEEPPIGDGHPMRVPGQVLED